MRLGIRGRFSVVAVGLIFLVGAASTVYVETQLRPWFLRHVLIELSNHAQVAGAAIEARGDALRGDDIAAIDALVDRIAEKARARLTVIAADGRVLGDSAFDPDRVRTLENHRDRPEVAQALGGQAGQSVRLSHSIDRQMLYAATPITLGGRIAVARAARPQAEVDDAVSGVRTFVIAASGIAMLVAVFMSLLASQNVVVRLRELLATARSVTGGEGARVEVSTEDEIGRLAGSLNLLSLSIERSFADLAEARDRLETVLESMGEGLLAFDTRQNITLANPEARSLLGLTGDPLGRTLLEAARAPALQSVLQRAMDGETCSGEVELVGRKRLLMVRATPLKVGGAVLVLHDITGLRRLENMRREFVANVSHELRTPVAVIRANTETLLDGALDDPIFGRRFLEGVMRNAERLSQLITDLLDISRIEAGQYAFEPADVPVAGALARALDTVSPRADSRRQVVDVDLEEDLVIHGDGRGLEQILINFADNAVKYTPEGGHILISGRRLEDGQVRLAVEDNGPGIEPRHRARLFERFYRVDPGRSREMGGTGLGLAIVKHLADAMKGEVGMDPREPRGCVFWVHLQPGRGEAAGQEDPPAQTSASDDANADSAA
ncbi:MAG: sensor histidine kinase [Planctomycetota bacterium]|jgi:two-component system phosphate regulon sensor histidine kinase PhoR